jgi:hypothetical protein
LGLFLHSGVPAASGARILIQQRAESGRMLALDVRRLLPCRPKQHSPAWDGLSFSDHVPMRTYQLCEGVFKLRLAEGGRVDADFVLTLRNPSGDLEHWDFGWNHQGLQLPAGTGRSLEEQFGWFIESLFDDHMSDLREGGYEADRGFDHLPVRLEVSENLLPRLS